MSQVTENIWIGSYQDVCNDELLNERKITHVLCCGEDLDLRAGYPYSKDRIGHKISIEDNVADEKTLDRFMEGAAKLNEWISQGRRIIVHCMAGMSRSVSVVITYLIVYKGWSYQTAYTLVKLRRWQTNIHPEFVELLEEMNPSFTHP